MCFVVLFIVDVVCSCCVLLALFADLVRSVCCSCCLFDFVVVVLVCCRVLLGVRCSLFGDCYLLIVVVAVGA